MLNENETNSPTRQLPAGQSNAATGKVAPLARALALHHAGKSAEAEAICVEILKRAPRHFGALNLAGVIAYRAGRFERAAELLKEAVAVNPDAPVAHNALGEALRCLGRPRLALESYNKALALKPDMPAALNNRALVLLQLKRLGPALADCDRAVRLMPDFAKSYITRGSVLRALKRPVAALENFDKAVSLQPKLINGHLNRAVSLNELNRFQEAVNACETAIALRPDLAQPYYNRANSLRDMNRIDDAIASYDEAIKRKPGYGAALWNQGNCFLYLGDYERGLKGYENRNGRQIVAKKRPYTEPMWLGEEDIAGKTLFIYPELYLGDMLQFCRYAKLAEERGAKVVLAAQDQLHTLLRTLSPTIELIGKDAKAQAFDFHTPLMSLPNAFRTRLENIPAPVAYLRSVDEERIARWRDKLGSQGFKIGICWRGNTTGYATRLLRSFSPLYFRKIAKMDGVRLISLQKPGEADMLASLPKDIPIETLGEDFDSGTQAFLDSAAVMQSLDLVITTDTAIAHLAGALGRSTWIVLKDVPDWRWLKDRSDSPWYPTARLFRQKKPGDWQSAFDEVEQALSETLAQKA